MSNLYKIKMPQKVHAIIDFFRANGEEAYIVGGCVRDSLLGRTPKDWDICTSAKPERTKELVSRMGFETIDTGIKHGTVTAHIQNGEDYEITTFRIDGDYSDSRHPDNVEFTEDIVKDLARRDFTINAMAYNSAGLIDPFGGKEDLKNITIKCVGDPDERLKEDPLRILRGLRFADKLHFAIAYKTQQAMIKNAHLLKSISAERIVSELRQISLCDLMVFYRDIATIIFPELVPCLEFKQNNPYHKHDVYKHIAYTIDNYHGDDFTINMALLLHDIGKPNSYTEDEKGGHFYGHPAESHRIAKEVLDRLKLPNSEKSDILDLILHHDMTLSPTEKCAKKVLSKFGEDLTRKLVAVKYADILDHTFPLSQARYDDLKGFEQALEKVIAESQCFSIKDLAVNGNDIMALGVEQGVLVGDILNELLQMVIDEKITNEKESLTSAAKEFINTL